MIKAVIVEADLVAKPQLAHVAGADRRLRLDLCPVQGREQHRRENRDNGDHYEQFDKGKAAERI